MSEHYKKKDPSRIRLVQISPREIMELFRTHLNGGQRVTIRGGTEIPAGCEVIGMPHVDHFRRMLLFTIWHESFTPVEEGELVPVLDERPEFEYVDVVEEAKKRLLEEGYFLSRMEPVKQLSAPFTGPQVVLDEGKPTIRVETCECLGWAPTYPTCRNTYHHPDCSKYRPDDTTPH